MIPKTIHYCWFGRGEMPQLAMECIESWHRFMPDWNYKIWNEDNFDVDILPYTREAYVACKYAFVSDVARLWALEHEGGVYLDVDFEVYKPFDNLLHYHAFAGIEGSKHKPVMMGVCASERNGVWVQEMLDIYNGLHFLGSDGEPDLTTNVQRLTANMVTNGFRQDGSEQYYKDLHVFPVDYFSPRQTTGEYLRTENTYCEHRGLASWSNAGHGYKNIVARMVGPRITTSIIKIKRKIIG